MKFRYCELEVTIGGPLTGTQSRVYMFQPDGKHTERTGGGGALMAQLGAEGWEVVASNARTDTGLGSKHKVSYIFKLAQEE